MAGHAVMVGRDVGGDGRRVSLSVACDLAGSLRGGIDECIARVLHYEIASKIGQRNWFTNCWLRGS